MKRNSYTLPLTIIIAGLLVSGTIFFLNRDARPANTPETPDDLEMRPVSEEDHILGSPNAQVVIIEYSDFECPFCKQFHETMHRVVDEYGPDGQVAWVFRHFPIAQLHSKAPQEAEAAECAAELGGNDGFWNYADRIFEITPSNNGLDLSLLPQIAEDIGLDRVAFEECLDSGRHEEKVAADYNDARAAGAQGTPYSVVLTRTGQRTVIEGAQGYLPVKELIDTLLGASAS